MEVVQTQLHRHLKDVDDTIAGIEFIIKRKLKAISETEKKVELTENDKFKISQEYDFISQVRRMIRIFKDSFNANLGKLPPADDELEESVLGALIIETPARNYGTNAQQPIRITDILKPKHFYKQVNEIIYQSILNLIAAGTPVDMRMVVAQLRKEGQLELIGGPAHIAYLTTRANSSANIEYHVRVLIEFAVKRQLILMASELMMDAYDDTQDAFNLLDRADALVTEAKGWVRK